jgi:hypothetical protein
MSKNHLPNALPQQVELLQAKIKNLQAQLNALVQKTSAFENLLRAKIENELIEEQKLSLLYKQQKKSKQAKRLAQKKSGKNYQHTEFLLPHQPKSNTEKNLREQQLKKQLYREAMLYVHPDKFSMQTDKLELATETTTQLIHIYRSGDLASLKAYHAHIFSGNTSLTNMNIPIAPRSPDLGYLKIQLKKLKQAIAEAKNKRTYKVLTEYDNPMTFLDELKAYYKDRIFKLRKRTRSQ